MTAPDRIPCLNPGCRRTAPAAKYEAGTEIVCSRCWKLLPRRLAARHRQLLARERRLLRLVERAVAGRDLSPDRFERVRSRIERQTEANWQAIRRYFTEPEAGPPQGLDGFLEEMGMQP